MAATGDSERRPWRRSLEEAAEVFDLGISPSSVPPEQMRRIRIIAIGTPAMFLVGIPAVVEFWRLGLHQISVALIATMVVSIANLALLRSTRRAILCSHLALGLLTSVIVASIFMTGGFHDLGFGWLYVLPLVAAALLDLRGAALWTGITLALTALFWSLPELGIHLTNHIPPELRDDHGLFTRITAILAIGLVAISFVTGQRQAERDLADANEHLFRESAYVQLLEHAAVSANEATFFDAAMRDGVDRICSTMGWPPGRIYLVSEEGALLPCPPPGRNGEAGETPPQRTVERRLLHLPQKVIETGRPVVLHDLANQEYFPRADLARRRGLRSALAVPVLVNGEVRAVLEFAATSSVRPDQRLLEVLEHMGIQLGRVAERAVLQERVRQSQKMEAVGQLAAGLAHEINNPMSYVRSNLNVLRDEWNELRSKLLAAGEPPSRLEDCGDLIDESLEGVERTISIVRDVKEFSHAGTPNAPMERADLAEILEGALRVTSPRTPDGVQLERSFPDLPACACSPNQIRQVFVNLIVNALQAVESSGVIRLSTGREGDTLFARVEDDGVGMSAATRERLFDPFFTTKPVGEGTGLGLYVSYEIVRSHGGEIRVQSEPNAGTCFEVRLPIESVRQQDDA